MILRNSVDPRQHLNRWLQRARGKLGGWNSKPTFQLQWEQFYLYLFYWLAFYVRLRKKRRVYDYIKKLEKQKDLYNPESSMCTKHCLNGILKLVQCIIRVAKRGGGGGSAIRGRTWPRQQLLSRLVKLRHAPASVETGVLGTKAWEKKVELPPALALSLQWHAADLEMGLPIRNTNKCSLHSLLSGPSGLGSGLHLFCLAVSKCLWASDQRLWGRKTRQIPTNQSFRGIKEG